ncbi:hypothetical protein L907_26715 [Agrobacterium sp. C13]|nr:hypothetical protein L906_26910 [Agrobacterium sp. TS45]KVK61074.1 hypothetical protein L907_26715 [Agrobacterium sp. C13]
MMTAAPIFPISACDAVSRKNGAADLDAESISYSEVAVPSLRMPIP